MNTAEKLHKRISKLFNIPEWDKYVIVKNDKIEKGWAAKHKDKHLYVKSSESMSKCLKCELRIAYRNDSLLNIFTSDVPPAVFLKDVTKQYERS